MPHELPIACTLTEEELPKRAAVAAELGADALVGLEVTGRRATLRFAGQRERVEALVAAESACCGFFAFDLTCEGDQTEVAVQAPEGADWAVRGLVAGLVAGWESRA